MKSEYDISEPRLIPSGDLAAYFQSNSIPYSTPAPLSLGFGQGRPQYCLFPYPPPAADETMGIFCEWHTEDFFAVDSGPHVAIGMRGPLENDPHRGRGLAIGILANEVGHPEDANIIIPLFKGCPDPPGGPAFFIEDFTLNDGTAPIQKWQLSAGRPLPQLLGNGIYRIDIHVSAGNVWAGVWKVTITPADSGADVRKYTFLDQLTCSCTGPGFSGDHASPCPQDPQDRGRGNAFIGSGFADPQTRSWVDNIFIAHWKNPVSLA